MANNEWASTEVSGLKELNDALKELPYRIARNVLRGATSSGAAVIRKEARALAPVAESVGPGHPPPGTLRRAIFQKQVRELSSLIKQTFIVSVLHSGQSRGVKAYGDKDAYYWRFVEFGTGKMAAKPFLRPAFESKKMAAIEAIKSYLAERIPREVAKLKQPARK